VAEASAGVLTSASLDDVAGKKAMVMRSVRVPLKLWEAAKDRAEREENDISSVVRELLEEYVNRPEDFS